MPPLLRASQIGKGVKLTATYLWRGRDAIRHEDSGFARSRGLRSPPFLQSTSQLSGPTLIFDPGHRPGAPPRFWKEHRPIPPPPPSPATRTLATPSPPVMLVSLSLSLFLFRWIGSSSLIVCLGKFNICGRLKDTGFQDCCKTHSEQSNVISVGH